MTAAQWDRFNPWRDRLVYVPIEILVHCCTGGSITSLTGFGTKITVPNDANFILAQWHDYRFRYGAIDGYILPQPDGNHSIGIRYGEEGSQYLSPYNANPELTEVLLAHYRALQSLPTMETPNV